MIRKELLLLTADQLNRMVDTWPSTRSFRFDYGVTVGVVFEDRYRICISRWGSYTDQAQFLFEVTYNEMTGNLPQVSWKFKDWIRQETSSGFKFTPPPDLMPRALSILMLTALEELQMHHPTSISS